MLLTDLQTKVGIVAERAIPAAALLMAATEVVNDIERRHNSLVEQSWETVTLDGSDIYTLTTAQRDLTRAIFYAPLATGDDPGTWERLVENPDLEPPNPTRTNRLTHYLFISSRDVMLSSRPSAGTLRVAYRTHGLPLAMTTPVVPATDPPTTTPTDVPHTALFMGVLAWFGRNIWLDQRTEGWEQAYEKAIKGELAIALKRTSTLGNLGARN